MTKIGPFEWNRCYYMDCIEGLKQLPDKSIDLCLTDPPFNVKYTGVSTNTARFSGKASRDYQELGTIEYYDTRDDYSMWCHQWATEIKRICKRYCIFVGRQNIKYWINDFRDIGVWYKPNSNGRGGTFWFVQHEFFITGGKWGNDRMTFSVLKCNANTGLSWLNHPCPRPTGLYIPILLQSKVKSVLDPFLGSGATAQAAESLGIPWLGFEIMPEYKPDIDKRIALGKKEFQKPKQDVLF